MSDPRFDTEDFDDIVAEIELVLVPAVLAGERKGTVAATRELARLLHLEGENREALDALADAFGVKS